MASHYIYPNGDVFILSGIDIDKDYAHTLFSTSLQDQLVKFLGTPEERSGYIKKHLTYYNYQRMKQNSIKVGINANELYDCNYLVFDCTRYISNEGTIINYTEYEQIGGRKEQKWFFAFIDEINYISEYATEIVYTIDVMQTYMFDYSMAKTMVEREHVYDDTIFNHIKPDFESEGNYVQRFVADTNDNILYGGIILNKPLPPLYALNDENSYEGYNASTNAADDTPANTGATLNVYIGMPIGKRKTNAIELNIDPTGTGVSNPQYFNNLVYHIAQDTSNIWEAYSAENIVATFTYPATWTLWSKNKTADKSLFTSYASQDVTMNSNTTLDGYTPRNKKCYTFQYNRALLTDNTGSQQRYAYELMTPVDGKYYFESIACYYLYPQVTVYPYGYKQYLAQGENYQKMLDYAITKTNYPEAIYEGNYFNSWYTQNKSSMWTNLMTNVLQTSLIASMSTNPMSIGLGIAGILTNGMQLNAKKEDLLRRGGTGYISGSQDLLGSSNLSKMCISIYNECLQRPFMETVDSFFDLYGYNVSTIKIPNIYSGRSDNTKIRKYWNYIKTINCDLHDTKCPCSVKTQIEEIYNKGITFWSNLTDMGDYSKDNTKLASQN